MPDDFNPGGAPDQFPGNPFGEAGTQSGTPLVAGSITLQSATPTSVNLSATDASGGAPPYSYQWERATSPGGPFTPVGGNALSLADTGLTAGQTYYYQLVYTDATSATDTASFTVTLPVGLGIAVHPDYLVEWEPPGIAYVVGERRPLKWTVSRADGATVDVPSAGGVSVSRPDGVTDERTPDVQDSAPVVTQIVAVDYTFDIAGIYEANLLVTIGDEIVGTTTPLVVKAYP